MLILLALLSNALGQSFLGGVVLFYFLVWPWLKKKYLERKWQKWSNTEKDVVILHTMHPGRAMPHVSPFALKVETFLRMTKIPYKTDISVLDAWVPKGRFPWISLNGVHMGDSQLIIEFLKKRFEPKLGNEYSPEERAAGGGMSVMVDQHLYWGIPMERFLFSSYKNMYKTFSPKLKSWMIWAYQKYHKKDILARVQGQGIGTHEPKEIQQLLCNDIQNLSFFLGKKKFILGEYPSEYDAIIFGHLAQFVWGLPETKYEEVIHYVYPNLVEYCNRMKQQYYPDWNKLVNN